MPTLAFYGARAGRDKERTSVGAAEAELWVGATSAAASRAIALESVDWYVLQEEAGVRAVLGEVAAFMGAL